MANETVFQKGDPSPPWYDKINPLWWIRSQATWTAPLVNNGQPYLPTVSNQLLRNFYWWCRNPIGNFVGFVVGVEDRDRTVTGPAPVTLVTLYDAVPPQYGFKWSYISTGWLRLPFVSYSGTWVLWYLGWRPTDGALGFKFNVHI